MKENERNENERPHIIWNSELKKKIDKLFKNGGTFASVAKELNLDASSFRKKVKKLGWDKEYNARLGATNKVRADNKIIKKLRWFSNSNLPHTKRYLLTGIKSNPNFKAKKGTLLKEDFIEQYYISRETNNLPTFNYDFSKLPDIIDGKKSKVDVFVNEVSTKTGNVIGEWKTCYHDLITCLEDNRSCAGMISKTKTGQYITTEDFIKRSKELFPEKFGYEKTNYINNHTPVTLRCLTCGREFQQTPIEHLHGTGFCPICAMKLVGDNKKLTQDEFIERVQNKYSDTIDLSKTTYDGLKNNIVVINPLTNEEVITTAESVLYGNFSFNKQISKGENTVSKILTEMNIQFIPHKMFKKTEIPEVVPFRSRVYVDFFIENYHGTTYIIEYNGVQHYKPSNAFAKNRKDFLDQVGRDCAIKKFCERMNFIFIEIPYTVRMEDKIKEGIDKILNKGVLPTDVFPTLIPEKINN